MSGHPWRFRTLVGLEAASVNSNLATDEPFGKDYSVRQAGKGLA